MNNKLTLCMTKGLPASGKSTWAKGIVFESEGKIKRINKDDLREMIDSGKFSKEREKGIVEIRDELINKFLSSGISVIVDDTNLHPKHEAFLKEISIKYNAEFIIKDFTDVSVTTCIERDAARREKSVGKKVITNMYFQYLNSSKLWTTPFYSLDDFKNKPKIIICDIDGTLAIHNGRSPYDFSKVSEDLFNYNLWSVLEMVKDNVIFVSGREGTIKCRKDTLEWLSKYTQIELPNLFMREYEDWREDSIIKKEIYENNIKPNYEVIAVFDDRDRVVDMWRSLGLFTCQVNYGGF